MSAGRLGLRPDDLGTTTLNTTALNTIAQGRDQWLAHGLSAQPADRQATESAVAQLYRHAGHSPPQFCWLPSPSAAITFITDHDLSACNSPDRETVGRGIAQILNALRHDIDRRLRVPELIAVRNSLRTSLFDGVATAIRSMILPLPGIVGWYGQHEAHRIAVADIARRLRLLPLADDDRELVDILITLTTSAGWWWPFDDVAVLSERPHAIHTEPAPHSPDNQRRLHHPDRPAVQFIDGTGVYVLHGTVVPDWVITDPTVERIGRERNIEIRRTAIERIGWDHYIDAAGLILRDQSADPANTDHPLRLYSTPRAWRTNAQLLVVVNGSLERDGTRRRYGLQVPGWIPTALDAAGWTYGLTGEQYSSLTRRT